MTVAADVAASHSAALGAGRLVDFDGLRVDNEAILSAVDFPGNLPANFLAQPRNLPRSLYCLHDIRLGIPSPHRESLWNRQFLLSIPNASAVRLKAMTLKSEKRGTTPVRGTMPSELTRFPE